MGLNPSYKTLWDDANASLNDFLNAAAAKQPAPGGGSVAALAGALAASMGEMVLNYSVGKKSLVAHEPELRTATAGNDAGEATASAIDG